MRIKVPVQPAAIGLFFLLALLCYQAHQLTRHFMGAALCDGFGSMTFAVSIPRQPCSVPVVLTLSGPLLTYGLAWLGMFLLRSRRAAIFAYALIFASFAHLRWIQTLTGRGDELILAQEWFGVSSRLLVAIAVFLIGLPPVVMAYRSIANSSRWKVFIGSWLLPLPALFVILFGDRLLFGASDNPGGASQIASLGPSFLGMSLVVLATDLIAALLLIIYAPRLFRNDPESIQGRLYNGKD